MSETGFLSDIETLRKRAREQIEQGALTSTYGLDRDAVVRVLNEALATELVCTLRYRRHYFMASGIASESVKSEFREHAEQEQEHADQIAARIVQLGGAPNFNPDARAHPGGGGRARRGHGQPARGIRSIGVSCGRSRRSIEEVRAKSTE